MKRTTFLIQVLDILNEIQKKIPVFFPLHPRTKRKIIQFKVESSIKKMNKLSVIDPIGYLDFLQLMSNATFVITDSGGIQEETTILGIPCVTIRQETERPITITQGTNSVVGVDREKILTIIQDILQGRYKKGKIPEKWDGKASKRIVESILNQLS